VLVRDRREGGEADRSAGIRIVGLPGRSCRSVTILSGTSIMAGGGRSIPVSARGIAAPMSSHDGDVPPLYLGWVVCMAADGPADSGGQLPTTDRSCDRAVSSWTAGLGS
jgi:hypothetical protein